jgi:putative transposase
MPRLPRFVLIDHPQHVIVRGNNREPIFCVEEDYRFYLDKLKQACDKHQCEVHAYVLMTNHVHLLITPRTRQGIGKVIQMVGRYYVQHFNYKYQRTGTLWEGRYKATLIDSEQYLLTCYRYIELNPVRASGMANHPSEYPWSSYRYNALGQADPNVTPHEEYLRLGSKPDLREKAYRELFNTHLEDKTLAEIREATNKAWVLGGGCFKKEVEQRLNRRAEPLKKGGDRRSSAYRNRFENQSSLTP